MRENAKNTLSVRKHCGSFAVLFPKGSPVMAYAIFKTGGKQYRVAAGDTVDVEKLDVEPGTQTTFSEVLFYMDGDNIRIGADLQGASVAAEVVDQVKAKKILAYKY